VAELFDSLTIRGVTFRNRIGVSPMVQTSAVDGMASDWHLVHLGSRAVGGAGLVVAEATAVQAHGRISINDLGLWKDEQVAPLRRIAAFIGAEGAVPGIQLAHGGRRCGYAPPFDRDGMRPLRFMTPEEGGWPVGGASPIPYGPGAPVPHELSADEIGAIVAAFGAAARRADAAGFDLVEIHGAHGYLPHAFYSPVSNARTDLYGGSLENRIRLFVEIATATRAALPDHKVLAARISYTDWVDGGWSLDDSLVLAERLAEAGVDLIDVSSGGNVAPNPITSEMMAPGAAGATSAAPRGVPQIPLSPGYQVPGAAAIRRHTGLPVAAVGLITEPEHANRIVADGSADMVMMARALLRDPYWPQRASIALGRTPNARIPVQYHLGWRGYGDFHYQPVSAPLLEEGK